MPSAVSISCLFDGTVLRTDHQVAGVAQVRLVGDFPQRADCCGGLRRSEEVPEMDESLSVEYHYDGAIAGAVDEDDMFRRQKLEAFNRVQCGEALKRHIAYVFCCA